MLLNLLFNEAGKTSNLLQTSFLSTPQVRVQTVNNKSPFPVISVPMEYPTESFQ